MCVYIANKMRKKNCFSCITNENVWFIKKEKNSKGGTTIKIANLLIEIQKKMKKNCKRTQRELIGY